ncbi:unannotated protein [freshwater metagenome]|uniref:Unannotated protein n=1 Tax=freshwater metagenome TaxID=449393 RepID=A0A6J7JX62_9ZZZZ
MEGESGISALVLAGHLDVIDDSGEPFDQVAQHWEQVAVLALGVDRGIDQDEPRDVVGALLGQTKGE